MVSARQGLNLLQSHSVEPLPTLVLEWRCAHDILHPVFLLVFLRAVQGVQIISISPGQQWPGFSFALHLLRVQGFYFALSQYSRIQAFITRFTQSMQSYTAHAAKQRTGLCRGFSCDLPRSTAHDTRLKQEAIIPPTPRWSIPQSRNTSSAYQIPTPCRTLYRPAQPPYYNKVYKGAAVRPCYGYMPDSAAYRRPCKPGGAVQQRGRGGRRGTIDGYRRISFRAFAR